LATVDQIQTGMVRVWVAGKTVWSPCHIRAISERFRDKELIIKRYINLASLLYFTSTVYTEQPQVNVSTINCCFVVVKVTC